MTPNQQYVIDTLTKRGADWTAYSVEQAWKKGESYYFDSRNKARRGLVRKLEQGNKEAKQHGQGISH